MFEHLFAWPDELPTPDAQLPLTSQIAIKIRLRQWIEAESDLLSNLALDAENTQLFKLLTYLHYERKQSAQALHYLSTLRSLLDPSDQELIVLSSLALLHDSSLDPSSLIRATQIELPRHYHFAPVRLISAAIFLKLGDDISASLVLDPCLESSPCLEALRLKAVLLRRQSKYQCALDLLLPAFARFPQHLELSADVASLCLEARSSQLTIPTLRNALNIHGEHQLLLPHVTSAKLLQRQPSLARRAALLERAWDTINPVATNPSNIINCAEQLGLVDWVEHINPIVDELQGEGLDVRANSCMQLASIESPLASPATQEFIRRITSQPRFLELTHQYPPSYNYNSATPLTIAWITGDLAYHPVARFLLGFFCSSDNQLSHKHLLISTQDHLHESYAHYFSSISNIEVIAKSRSLSPERLLLEIRDYQPHVAIDLSGWTGGNFLTGFMAGLAPVQINYLGYFASTGVPNMQFWLGDKYLFPDPVQEWHTERIVRLNRCFLAWSPPPSLPEASVPVCEPPQGPVHFGSFNHNRKLSDFTLRLWAQILVSIPGSRLVLKANAPDDPGTQAILRRRMLTQGLPLDQILWLPIAKSPIDHLNQYSLIDISLDSYPNGGCTTTCESLWMGAPVITLTGRSYVSRMSTAVLYGAGLSSWVATTPSQYVSIAVAQADQISSLRSRRSYWREKIKNSELGDAKGLMSELENCFLELYNSVSLARSV